MANRVPPPRDFQWARLLRTLSFWALLTVGVVALIQFTYATPATGPGYYLSELLPLDSGRDLRLTGFMRDTLRAQVLLEIARSVRIATE